MFLNMGCLVINNGFLSSQSRLIMKFLDIALPRGGGGDI